MHYRRLGSSGLQLSALSFGAWLTFGAQVGRGVSRDLVAAAWDHGINFFDNAEGYANGNAETVMGDVIADLRLPRDGFCVSSKVLFGSAVEPKPTQKGLSRKHVTDACHAALKRLRVDYLDLYYCHRPDPDTPVEETVWAMDALIRQGKVLYWGTSEWPAALIREAHKVARAFHLHAPTMEQPQYNLLHRERVEMEYAPLYAELGLGTTTFSPLASGLLTGKYAGGMNDDARLGREGMGWLQRIVVGDSEGARVCAGDPGDRLVPAQSARIQRDPRREPGRTAAAEPAGAGVAPATGRRRVGEDRSRGGVIREFLGLLANLMRIIII